MRELASLTRKRNLNKRLVLGSAEPSPDVWLSAFAARPLLGSAFRWEAELPLAAPARKKRTFIALARQSAAF